MRLIVSPTECPVCNSKLELVKDQLFCRNTQCEAQVYKKIEHFAKTLKIKGLGPATIAKLGLSDITEIYFLDETQLSEAVGDKLAAKLLEEIKASETSDFATVLAAMSIPLVGKTISTKLAQEINSFEEISAVTCQRAGIGEKATNNLQDWLYYEYPEIKEFLPFKFERFVSSAVCNGKVVCITGKLSSFSTKKDAAEALKAKGYKVTDSLTKTVDFLVDEENKSSSKRVKAESYNITIISDLSTFLSQN
jgi:DNA ligase (NAD+)